MTETIRIHTYTSFFVNENAHLYISYRGQEEARKHLGSRNFSQGWKLSNERRDETRDNRSFFFREIEIGIIYFLNLDNEENK